MIYQKIHQMIRQLIWNKINRLFYNSK
jgi:hypothetical protein